MFIELVDALRCPRAHAESWLVLATSRINARHIQEGALGCPVCRAEYPIRDGIVDLRLDRTVAPTARAGQGVDAPLITRVPADHLAAMLSLGDALGFAVLIGAWGRHAAALLDLANVPPLLLVDPPADVEMVPGMSGVLADAVLPLAVGSARAVAADDDGTLRLESAVQTTRAGGRVVAPAHALVPDGVRELVRDEHVWVGEREALPSAFVRLHVRRG
ncbi:MAG TPA: Trm112 family protein [Gemmatimonadaceae bacterium]|nr:Trm112 family protein [Gemmatimonadaceae bacterium]